MRNAGVVLCVLAVAVLVASDALAGNCKKCEQQQAWPYKYYCATGLSSGYDNCSVPDPYYDCNVSGSCGGSGGGAGCTEEGEDCFPDEPYGALRLPAPPMESEAGPMSPWRLR